MAETASFNVVYDQRSDVLYLNKRREAAARGVEDKNGIVWRYDDRGQLLGATVVDFYDNWFNKRSALADEIAKRFMIPSGQAEVVIDRAMADAHERLHSRC